MGNPIFEASTERPMRADRTPLRLTAVVAASVALGACTDAPTEPGELWVALETEAALRIDAEPPTLPNIVERVRARDADDGSASRPVDDRALARAAALWRTTEGEPAEAPAVRRVRDRAYTVAADALALALDSAELTEMRRGLEGWLDGAEAARIGKRVPSATATLERARRSLASARAARDADDRAAEVTATLVAAEWLTTLTPSSVARRVIRRAEALASSAPEPVSARETRAVARANRLIAGARDALNEGDPVRAIRRAYYATRLLDPR